MSSPFRSPAFQLLHIARPPLREALLPPEGPFARGGNDLRPPFASRQAGDANGRQVANIQQAHGRPMALDSRHPHLKVSKTSRPASKGCVAYGAYGWIILHSHRCAWHGGFAPLRQACHDLKAPRRFLSHPAGAKVSVRVPAMKPSTLAPEAPARRENFASDGHRGLKSVASEAPRALRASRRRAAAPGKGSWLSRQRHPPLRLLSGPAS